MPRRRILQVMFYLSTRVYLKDIKIYSIPPKILTNKQQKINLLNLQFFFVPRAFYGAIVSICLLYFFSNFYHSSAVEKYYQNRSFLEKEKKKMIFAPCDWSKNDGN